MNEEELKTLWQTDRAAPVIDFFKFRNSLHGWQSKLRRKTRIDIWTQSITAILCLIPIYFYPRMIFAYAAMLIITIWYVRELRKLSELETEKIDSLTARQLISANIERMQKYFRQMRFVMYVISPLVFHAAIYGLGHYDRVPNSPDWTALLIKSIIFSTILYEILIVAANEIYFAVLYKPAYKELKNLLNQLEAEE